MAIVDFLRGLIYSIAYLIVVSGFFIEKKKTKSLAYFAVVFAIVTKAAYVSGFEVYINYLAIAATTIAIGHENLTGSKYWLSYLTGFSHALTIFATFQWGAALIGSIVFITLGQSGLGEVLPFALLFYCLISAYLLRRFSKYTFRDDLSKALLVIGIGARILFILFFNVIFPRFFTYLGAEPYSILAIILLLVFAFYVVYQEYSVRLEKQIALQNYSLEQITLWAAQTISKYEDIALRNSEKIILIHNPIIQALLYDFTATSVRLGIEVEINLSGTFDEQINLNNFDLFNILNDFLDNALHEVKRQTNEPIYVEVEGGSKYFRFTVKTAVSQSEEYYGYPDFKKTKDNIIAQVTKNRNIAISYSKAGRFVQALEIN